jgi:hypothetical protein
VEDGELEEERGVDRGSARSVSLVYNLVPEAMNVAALNNISSTASFLAFVPKDFINA